jgi:lysophospholipid acyltransferase (LPLAT)-like uncharacterized protein
MGLGKRLLTSRLVLGVARMVMRAYRDFAFGGFLFRHDPALLGVLRAREPVIFAIWHQDFMHTLGYLSRWNSRRRTYVLASDSRDGGVAAAVAEGVGFRPAVRGSSAKGGSRALLALHRRVRERPGSVAIVCDGPRPPARELKPGVLQLARDTGQPLWLVRTSYRPVKVLDRTWANFHWPAPWARGVCVADGPIVVPPGLDREGLDRLREEVEGRLNRLADRGEALVERQGRGGTHRL